MSLCDFNFQCSDTQKQKEFFNVETKKNESQSSPPNLEKQKDTQPNYHLNYLNSSSLFSKINSKRKEYQYTNNQIVFSGKIQSPLILEPRTLEDHFKAKLRLNILMNNGTRFNKSQNILLKLQGRKKIKIMLKKTQESQSNNNKKIYEVTILSLIIGYFVKMIYTVSKEIFFQFQLTIFIIMVISSNTALHNIKLTNITAKYFRKNIHNKKNLKIIEDNL